MEDSLLVTTLFIIVSVLLIVDIVVAVTIYKILKKVETVVDRAESTTASIANISKAASDLTVPLALSKIVKATAEKFNTKPTRKKNVKKIKKTN